MDRLFITALTGLCLIAASACNDSGEGNTPLVPKDTGGQDASDAGDTQIEDVEPDGQPDVVEVSEEVEDTSPDLDGTEGCTNTCPSIGATRCSPEDGVDRIQVCSDVDGCRAWVDGDDCLTTNLCTGVADVCEDGACVPPSDAPDPIAKCDTPDDPCMIAVCEPSTGACDEAPNPDPVPCDDFNVCTNNDACFDGVCGGTGDCPKACVLDDLDCGTAIVATLSDLGSDVMDAYGCEGYADGYGGFEISRRLQPFAGNPDGCAAKIAVELMDPADAGAEYVDAFLLDYDAGICNPQECTSVTEMGDDGRLLIDTSMPAGSNLLAVFDGRNDYNGEVRVAASCCNSNVELFCGDGTDNDGDGQTDCDDSNCQGTPLCNFEFNCSDNLDNDQNGATDCDDPYCDGNIACAGQEADCNNNIDDNEDGNTDCDDPTCSNAINCVQQCPAINQVLTCGSTVVGASVADDGISGGTSFESFGCPSGSGPYTNYDFLFYSIEPNCEGTYEVVITPQNTNFPSVDAFALYPGCSANTCADETVIFAGEPLATMSPFNASLTPHVFLAVTKGWGAPDPGPLDIEVNCTCN